MRLLHVIPDLSFGGAQLTILELIAKLHQAGVRQSVIVLGLLPARARKLLDALNVPVLQVNEEDEESELLSCDAVVVHFWHTARMYDLLCRRWPPVRVAVYCHILGSHAPQCLSDLVLSMADLFVATSPATLDLKNVSGRDFLRKTVPACGNIAGRSRPFKQPGEQVNVGYLGLVDRQKMHPRFVEMTSAISRSIMCDVWGPGGDYELLKGKAMELNSMTRFRFHGPTNDVATALSQMDIFGYPLCDRTYATSERALQEAMAVGLAPVVFDRPGYRDYVRNEVNALVVRDECAYVDACTRLVDDPDLRARIGASAQKTVIEKFVLGHHLAGFIDALNELIITKTKRVPPRPELDSVFRGAAIFSRAMASEAPCLLESLGAKDTSAAEQADDEIVHLPWYLCVSGNGTLMDYRLAFEKDGMILYWSGLNEFGRGALANAFASFLLAKRYGGAPDRLDKWIKRTHQRMMCLRSEPIQKSEPHN